MAPYTNNATLTVFSSHANAEAAVRQLAQSGYDLGKVSMVACESGRVALQAGAANENGQRASSAKADASWAGMRAMLVGSGFFLVPGVGPLVIAGPLLTWIIRAMGPLPGSDKLDAMGAGLRHLGIPDDSIVRCETLLRAGKVVVIAEGSAMAMILAREVFRRTPVEVIEQHARLPE